MKKYVFGGYVETAGKFDDGREWKSMVILLGSKFGDEPPRTAKAYKARAFIAPTVKQISIGAIVNIQFDEDGKIIGLNVI